MCPDRLLASTFKPGKDHTYCMECLFGKEFAIISIGIPQKGKLKDQILYQEVILLRHSSEGHELSLRSIISRRLSCRSEAQHARKISFSKNHISHLVRAGRFAQVNQLGRATLSSLSAVPVICAGTAELTRAPSWCVHETPASDQMHIIYKPNFLFRLHTAASHGLQQSGALDRVHCAVKPSSLSLHALMEQPCHADDQAVLLHADPQHGPSPAQRPILTLKARNATFMARQWSAFPFSSHYLSASWPSSAFYPCPSAIHYGYLRAWFPPFFHWFKVLLSLASSQGLLLSPLSLGLLK